MTLRTSLLTLINIISLFALKNHYVNTTLSSHFVYYPEIPKHQALRIHERTVNRHLTDYKEGKLSTENGGSESKLTEQQTEELIAHLSEKTYHYTHEIIDYIEKVYGVTYSIPGLNKWLHRNNFSYKKPKGHPYKSDKLSQDKFVKRYNKLKSAAGKIDSVHPSRATKLSYGWFRTGETKCVCTTASRTRMNIIGGIELGKLKHTIISGIPSF